MPELTGFAVLPADTFAEGPPSGNFIDTNNREIPFDSQPVQGFSAVQFAPGNEDGSAYWFLSDNGFGAQGNSADYLLRLYQVDPDFTGAENGDASVDVQAFVQLADPNNVIPFEIVNEGTSDRLLTGADFDIESVVILENNNRMWIGDEFGPYLLPFNLNGTLVGAPIATPNINELNTLNGQEPLVIGHRGASGSRPEHTLASYELAIEKGADFIEPDLVPTKDGVLIARHENALATVELDDNGEIILDQNGNPTITEETTNVAELEQFADRLTVKEIDGRLIGGWFSEDFTLAEIKQLRARERLPEIRPLNTVFNDEYEIPTLAEVIDLVKQVETESGRTIGIYPETKHPTFFAEEGTFIDGNPININTSQALIDTLVAENFTDPNRIFIQSFEVSNLQTLNDTIMPNAGVDIPLVQLIGGGGAPYDFEFNNDPRTYSDLITPTGLTEIANYAAGIGPSKTRIIPSVNGVLSEPTTLVDDAHAAGLQVHPYTFRSEENFLATEYETPAEEYQQFIELGVDGYFTDFPLEGDRVRDQITADEVRSPQNPNIQFNSLSGEAPLVIGHRGASGERPEHTLEAYRRAIAQGADFIEPDLVPTKDGFLVARHENEISGTTNVADRPEFADRQTTKIIDGTEFTGWFTEDFTLAELKTLRAKERIPGTRPDNTAFDGLFEVPTLEEVIDLVKEVEAETGKQIGIYPETKHPTFFAKEGSFLDGTPININTSQILVDTLVAENFTDPERIFLQSFEIENLLELQNEILPAANLDIPLVQLLGDFEGTFVDDGAFSVPYDVVYNFDPDNANAEPDTYDNFPIEFDIETNYGDLANAEVIDFIGENYAEGLGPWKNSFLLRESIDTPVDGNGDGEAEITSQLTGEVLPLIDWAHNAGMQVHPYTLRNEENFLTLNSDGTPQTPEDEFRQLIDLGVDGFFTDFPETGRIVVDQEIELPNLSGSRGYEGMAFSPDRQTLYPLLEGAVVGDPDNALRIYEFDVASQSFEGLVGFYPTDVPGHAIGDFTPINENEFLVIERDGGEGDAAEFKKIFKIDISDVDAEGFVAKEEVVDLLDIDDPNDLNNDGSTSFAFPFVTIEDVLVLDEDTILVANDNNYPFSVGRGPDIDNNEIILLDLDEPLDLDERLGAPGEVTPPPPPPPVDDDQLIEGSPQAEAISGGTGDDTIIGLNGADTLVGSDGDDEIIGSRGNDFLYGQNGNDRLDGRQGFDFLFGGNGDDVLNGGQGRDRFNGGPGNDTMIGGASIDYFIYNSNAPFDSDDFGVDTIEEFQQRDLILLDKSTFTALDSAAGDGFSVNSDFVIVDNDADADNSNAFIVYSEASGSLFYNSNLLAILDGAPTISEDNFVIRN